MVMVMMTMTIEKMKKVMEMMAKWIRRRKK